jgi:undecaprenyl-diphosphatase
MTIQTIDTQLLVFINQALANAVFDVLMPALTQRGYLLVIPFLFIMLERTLRQRDQAGRTHISAAIWAFLIACLAVYLGGLAEDALKAAIGRVRPCRALADLRLLIPCPKSFSLPSGHAVSSFAFAAPLFYLTRGYVALGWRSYPLALASLIAFSRVYLGVHYPTDIMAGALLGGTIGMALSVVYQILVTKDFVKWKK